MSAANLNTIPDSITNPGSSTSTPVPIAESIPEPAVEAVPASIPPSKEAADKLTSTRFAHLSKKEAALVKEREQLKKEMESFKQQQSEQEKYRKAWEMVNEIAELQKTDEIAAMRKAGFNDANIMNLLAQAQDNTSPEEKAAKMAKSEIDKFRLEQQKLMEENNKKATEAKQAEEAKTIARFKTEIGSHIKSTADKYEYLNFYGEHAQELVYETISTILQDSNEMISIDEASQLVEDFYEEQDKAMNSLKKRAKFINPPKTTTKQPEQSSTTTSSAAMPKVNRVESKQFVDNKTPTKTLSNRMTASTSTLAEHNLSPAENKQRVIDKYLNAIKR